MPPTMRVIDLTHTITPDIPVYPGTEPPTFEPASTYERDGFRETLVTMYTHTGTHIDPPYHLYPGRTRLDEFPADRFVGMALRIDCRGIPEGDPITMDRLRPYGDLIRQADFLLFNTGWDSKWGTSEYFGDYPCIDDEVLDLIIEGDYRGIGFDVILVYAFRRPSFIIDSYTRRLVGRLIPGPWDDMAIRAFFSALPQDAETYGMMHRLILEHCIGFCRKEPRCGRCPLCGHCPSSQMQAS